MSRNNSNQNARQQVQSQNQRQNPTDLSQQSQTNQPAETFDDLSKRGQSRVLRILYRVINPSVAELVAGIVLIAGVITPLGTVAYDHFWGNEKKKEEEQKVEKQHQEELKKQKEHFESIIKIKEEKEDEEDKYQNEIIEIYKSRIEELEKEKTTQQSKEQPKL